MSKKSKAVNRQKKEYLNLVNEIFQKGDGLKNAADTIKKVLQESFCELPETSSRKAPALAKVGTPTLKVTNGSGTGPYYVFEFPFTVNYHGMYATRIVTTSFAVDTKVPVETLLTEIQKRIQKHINRLRNTIANLPPYYPDGASPRRAPWNVFQQISLMRDEMDFRGSGECSFVSLMNKCVSTVQTELNKEMSSYILDIKKKELKTLGALPEDIQEIQAVMYNIQARMHKTGFSPDIRIRLTATYSGGRIVNLNGNSSMDDLFPIFRAKNKDAAEDIVWEIQRVAAEIAKPLISELPACIVPSELLPESFLEIVKTGEVQCGRINASCKELKDDFDRKLYCKYAGKGKYVFVLARTNTQAKRELVITEKEILRDALTPVKLRSKAGGPAAPVVFVQFCKAANAVYEEFSAKQKVVMPIVSFVFRDGKISDCAWDHGSIPVSKLFDPGKKYDTTISVRLKEVFAQIAEKEAQALRDQQHQIEALGRLNPTELSILRRAVANGRTWLSDINEHMEIGVLTTKTCNEDYLQSLCDQKIKVNGNDVPLLVSQWAKSDYRRFWLYKSPVNWGSGVVEAAKPRPYTVAEMDNMTFQGKEFFFSRLLNGSAGTASKWDILSAVEKLPKQCAAEFIKSNRGKEFFQSLDGDDAVYAKFLLEGTPGCKRLASAYFAV